MGLGAQSPSLGGISSVSLQQLNSVHSPSGQHPFAGVAKDAGIFCIYISYIKFCFITYALDHFLPFLFKREWL